MKPLLFSSLMFLTLALQAQSDKYVAIMKQNLALFDSAKTTADYQTLANSFERIADAEKTQWLPYYYSALALIIPAWTDTKLDKDVNAVRATALTDKAELIEKNGEIYSLRYMIATQQMLVDPQTRYATFGAQGNAALQKGLQADPDNPRLWYLQAQNVFGTPASFGGGKVKAKPIFEKSIALFKKEQPKPLYPNWGLQAAETMLAQCQ